MNKLPGIISVIEGESEGVVDLLNNLGERLFGMLINLPLNLQQELSMDIMKLAKQLELYDELEFVLTIMNRLDTAFMAMKNESMTDVPPNFLKLLRWYNNYGPTTLKIWLEALFNETLHEFLVENQLPVLLNDTRNFFCGPEDNLSPYFKDPSLQQIRSDLCEINWQMVGQEIVQYYTMDMKKNETNVFKAIGAGYRIATELLVQEGMKLFGVVEPFYHRVLRYNEIEL